MINQLMSECYQLAVLAGYKDHHYVSLTYGYQGSEKKFEASYFNMHRCYGDQPEDALTLLKLKLIIMVEDKAKETQKVLGNYQEQLNKMNSVLNQVGGNNGTQINS